MPLTNTELKNLKLLRSPGKGERRSFLAEGVRVLEESVRHRVPAEMIVVCEDRLTDRGKTLVGRMEKLGGVVRSVPSRQLEAITDAETSQGLAAVFVRPIPTLEQLAAAGKRRILICDGISDPGNLGTLFRSALAFGFTGVIVCGESVDAYAPKTVRASAGAVFGLKIAMAAPSETGRWLAASQIPLLVADAEGKPLEDIKPRSRRGEGVALAVGSEARGVSHSLREAALQTVGIRHESSVESLNAAVAGSILMKGIYDTWQFD